MTLQCHFANSTTSSCTPNAFLYYNPTTRTVTLHALRLIRKYEEITISYFQNYVALDKAGRAAILDNWQFTSQCNTCSSGEESESNRTELVHLCEELDEIYGNDDGTREYTLTTIGKLLEIVAWLERKGLLGLELLDCRLELANLFGQVGNWQERRRQIGIASHLQIICMGTNHPLSQSLREESYHYY